MKVRHSWHKILYLWRDLLFAFFTLCIALLLRVWDLSQQQYREDDANLRNLVLRLLQTGLWPVHGMHSSLGLPNGPFQVLLLLPVALVSTKPPVLTLTVAMLNVAACFLLYAFARDAWGRGVASLALLFASINPWAVVLSRRLWGDDMLAPFAVLTAWMFYRWRFRGDTRALVIAAISLAIACQVYIVGLELLVPAAILLISGFRSLWRVSTLVAGITFAALMFPYTQAALLPHLLTLVHIEAPSAVIGYSRPAHSDATSLRYALELASSEGYQAFAPQAGTIFNITSGFAAILNGLLRTLYIGGLILGLFSLLQWLRTHARSGDGVHLYLLLIFLIPVLALTRHSVPVYPYYFVTTFPLPYLYPAITCHRLWKASAVLPRYVGVLRSSLTLMVMAIITLDAIAALAFFRAIKGFWPESPYGMPYAMTQRLVQQTVALAQHSGIATIILPEHTQAGNILASELRRDHLHVITIDDRTTFLFPQQPALYFSFGNGFSQQFLQQHCEKDLLYQTTLPGAGLLVQWYLSSPPLTLHPPRENPILLHLLWRGHPLLLLWTLQLPRRTTPGAHVTALLTYRVDNATPQSPPFSLYVHLLTNSGKPVTQEDEAAPAFPNLASGDTVLQRFTLALPSSTPPQLLNVSVGGYIASSLKPLRWQTPQGQQLPPGSFLTHILIPPPSPASPSFLTTLQFADGIRLLGYTLAQHGRTLRVTLDWEATEKLHTHYTAYVHLLSPRGKLIAQNDAPPAAGNFPTTFWQVGDHIADRHLLELPPDLPPGSYLLQIGLYNSQTLQPLLVLEGHNRFPITLHSQ